MKRTTFPCSILPSTTFCTCGGEWKKKKLDFTHIQDSICSDCGQTPQFYRVRKFYNELNLQFSYDAKGNNLRTFHQAYFLNQIIDEEMSMGIFKREKYPKQAAANHINRTVEEFIEASILPTMEEGDEKILLREFIAPYFADVGVFVVNKIHMEDFIRTFRFKGERAQMARELFDKVVSQISL